MSPKQKTSKHEPNGRLHQLADGSLVWEHIEGQPLYPKPVMVGNGFNRRDRRRFEAQMRKARNGRRG